MNTNTLIDFESENSVTFATVKTQSITTDAAIREVCRELKGFVQMNPGMMLCLDLSHVEFFSVAVLTDLLGIQCTLEEGSGSLQLCGVHGNIHKILKLAEMDKKFSITSLRHMHSVQ